MPQVNPVLILLAFVTVVVGAALWRMLSTNKDVRQQELAGLLGGASAGVDATDIANFVGLMGWGRAEAAHRLAHAISMVKVACGPEEHEASLVVYGQVLDQMGDTQRLEPHFLDTDGSSTACETLKARGLRCVASSDWRVVRGTLQRAYAYQGLGSVHHLLLCIDRSEGLYRGAVDYHFHMIVTPHPWQEEEDEVLVAQLGPEGDLMSYPVFNLRCSQCEDGSFLAGTMDQDGTNAALLAISQCVPLRLRLSGMEGVRLELIIPNDYSFSAADFVH